MHSPLILVLLLQLQIDGHKKLFDIKDTILVIDGHIKIFVDNTANKKAQRLEMDGRQKTFTGDAVDTKLMRYGHVKLCIDMRKQMLVENRQTKIFVDDALFDVLVTSRPKRWIENKHICMNIKEKEKKRYKDNGQRSICR